MALFHVDIVLSPHEIPPGLDPAEATERVRTACCALIGLGEATVSIARSSESLTSEVNVRNGTYLARLPEDAAMRLAAIVRLAVRQTLTPRPSIVG